MSKALYWMTVAVLLVGLQSCDFYRPRDLVKEGMSQSALHALIGSTTSIELTDRDNVENAFTDSGRDPTTWFSVVFDPEHKNEIPAKLIQRGYELKGSLTDPLPRPTPPQILAWWDATKLTAPILFVLRREKGRDDADGVWCFFDSTQGKLLGCTFSH